VRLPLIAMPATFVTDPCKPLARWTGDGVEDGWKAVTIGEAFEHKAAVHGNLPALRAKSTKEQKEWTTWTVSEYLLNVKTVAKALIKHGFQRYDAVNILGFNSAEWFFTAYGAILAGGMSSGIYITNLAPACQYILEHSNCKFVFVDSQDQLDKVLAVRQQCPNLQSAIVWGPDQERLHNPPFVWSWQKFVENVDNQAEVLDARMSAQSPADACYLSYTSGTTGPPKAVMYSQDNCMYGLSALSRRMFDFLPSNRATGLEEREVCYLPMSHIAGSATLFGMLAQPDHVHRCCYFAFPDAMAGSLVPTLKEVEPTIFIGVPRVWEKMYDALRAAIKANPKFDGNPALMGAVGLSKVKAALVGAAPMQEAVFHFFDKHGLEIQEVYGMTENTAVSHLSCPGMRKVGTVGRPTVFGTVKLDPNTNEILVKCRANMMGYMKNPEKTQETFDEDGWLKTGDIGAVETGPQAEANVDGYYRIVGRIKELIITAGGENIPPVLIESEIKQKLPMISNAVVIGDRQKMLVLLLTLKLKPTPTGAWTDQLDLESAAFDSSCTTLAEAKMSKKWQAAIDAAVSEFNAKIATSRAQNIRGWALLDTDFTPNVELTPTLKLKREVVHTRYSTVIRGLYGDMFVEVPWGGASSKL